MLEGGANALKRRRISAIIKKGEADIFFIQEIKLTKTNDFFANSMWSNTNIRFSFTNSIWLSGGIQTL